MIVVDASVFNKLFLDEPDRVQAQALFRYAIEHELPLLAPDLLLYEILSVALHYEIPFAVVYRLLDAQRAAGMQLVEPSLAVLETAEAIARSCSQAKGHPSLQDSIYHALAIEIDGTFVTADHRHAQRAEPFGHVCLLKDWQPA
jgi:predicted nucleic acid-binding protein